MTRRSEHAAWVFSGIAASYDRVAAVLSFGQDPRWRAALVREVRALPGELVLDVATGTGMVADALQRRYSCRVVGLDQSDEMLGAAGRNSALLVRGRAERLPFADESFDHVTFTYLLRYVDDPAATLRELGRVLRPGGRLAALEFALPRGPLWRPLWWLYTRVGLPLGGRLVSRRWREVGAFLGPSIERFYRDHPQHAVEEYWRVAGIDDLRIQRMSLGGGVVMSGTKRDVRAPAPPRQSAIAPAFYALRPGGWRDYWTLVHPPYTIWHLSYVPLAAALAPTPDPRIVLGGIAAFALAVGVGAHAFDELAGRPLGTRIPVAVLVLLGVLGVSGAVALGVLAAASVGWPFLGFVLIGGALVVLYAFDAPLVHTDSGFALAWGAFPVLATAYAVAAPPLPTVLVALGAALLSLAQRRLSTRVRAIRRRAVEVRGSIRYQDGSVETLDARALIAAPEAALRIIWLVPPVLAAGALAARWL